MSQDLEVGELVIGREQRMGLRLPLDLLDLDQRFIAHPGFSVGLVDRPPLKVDVGRIHAPIREVGVVRDREKLVARLALAVHPRPQVVGSGGSSALNGIAGTWAQSLKKILRWRFMLFGMDVHS